MSLATIRESPGLDAYLEGLEERLAAAVEACPGLVATGGAGALAAGGKRLPPLLVFLTAPQDTPPLPAGAAGPRPPPPAPPAHRPLHPPPEPPGGGRRPAP